MNTAERVIEKCGGPQAVAEMVGVHVSRVHRWGYPPERGGTGGIIPARHQQTLLTKARQRGIPLEPADFFEAPQDDGEAAPKDDGGPREAGQGDGEAAA